MEWKVISPRDIHHIGQIESRGNVKTHRMWLTSKAGRIRALSSRLRLTSALSLCLWVCNRIVKIIIFFSRGRWSTTREKIRSRRPNTQYPSRKEADEQTISDDGQQAFVQCSQRNVKLRSEVLLLTSLYYMNSNLKRWKKDFYGTHGNKNKILLKNLNSTITGCETGTLGSKCN